MEPSLINSWNYFAPYFPLERNSSCEHLPLEKVKTECTEEDMDRYLNFDSPLIQSNATDEKARLPTLFSNPHFSTSTNSFSNQPLIPTFASCLEENSPFIDSSPGKLHKRSLNERDISREKVRKIRKTPKKLTEKNHFSAQESLKQQRIKKLVEEREQWLRTKERVQTSIKQYCEAFPNTTLKTLACFSTTTETSHSELINEQNITDYPQHILQIIERIISETMTHQKESSHKIIQLDIQIQKLEFVNRNLVQMLYKLIDICKGYESNSSMSSQHTHS